MKSSMVKTNNLVESPSSSMDEIEDRISGLKNKRDDTQMKKKEKE
jgi:hypothetical protein